MTELAISIRPEAAGDREAIERLHERAFGPGRFARSAFRLREGAAPRPDLCFTAMVGTLLVGSVRLSRVLVGSGEAAMLGPLAVDPVFEGRGIGAALIGRAIERAREAGFSLVLLVGDEPYYARFGFSRVPAGQLAMPGPVDPARLLAAELVPDALANSQGRIRSPRNAILPLPAGGERPSRTQ